MNPSLVTTGSINGGATAIQPDASSIGGQAVQVTLNRPYSLSYPPPPGWPTIPSLTGAAVASSFPGRVIPAGTTLTLVPPEAAALIAAGATTQFPGFASISVTHGTNPTISIAITGDTFNTAKTPAAGAFSVTDNGSGLTVSSVTVNAASISLGITGTIALGDAVLLTYTPPGTNPAQDVSGNLLAAIVSSPVTVS